MSPAGKSDTDPPDVVDTHVHFWDHSVPGLSWAWLEREFRHPRARTLHRHDAARYTAPELAEEAGGAGVAKVVHVQSARWTGRPERETAWLERVADEHGWPDALVAGCRLAEAGAEEVVDRQSRFRRFRGVRDLRADQHLEDPAFDRGVAALAERGVVLELTVSQEHLPAVVELARRHPDLTVVLDHAGLPSGWTDEHRRRWVDALESFRSLENVVGKISALLTGLGSDWSVDGMRPWVEACVDVFSPRRAMFGSNWPVDKLYATYAQLIAAYRSIAGDWHPDDARAVLSRTAERVYRI